MIQTFSLAVLKIWYILSYRASLMWLNFMLDQTPAFYIVVFTLSVHRQSWGRGGGLGGDMVSEGGIPNKTWQGVNKKLIRCQVTWQSGENWPQGLLMKNCGCQKEERISALKNYHLKPQKLLTAWLKIRNCVRLITLRAVWALCCHKRFDPHLPNTPNTIA